MVLMDAILVTGRKMQDARRDKWRKDKEE